MAPESSGDDDRSGRNVEEAIDNAEKGTPVAGRHTVGGSRIGASRVERTADVDEITEGRSEGGGERTQPPPARGPEPPAVGSGGAQRTVGARISDRESAGEPTPDGPPFDAEDQDRS